MVDFDRLRRSFATKQNPERVYRMWRVVEAAHHEKASSWRIPLRIIAVSGIASVVVVLALILESQPIAGPLRSQQGEILPSTIATTQTTLSRFSDGSFLRAEAGSEINLIENTSESVRFELKKGELRFDIIPGGSRIWRIDCGKVVITVLGTVFVVKKEIAFVNVVVERGAVVLSGDAIKNGEKKLSAGESIRVAVETAIEADTNPIEATPPPSPPEVPPTPVDRNHRAARTSWRLHAEVGDYDEAFERLGSAGVTAIAKSSRDVDELFKLADVARLSGHPLSAVEPLEKIVEKFDRNPQAGLAAYTLGRLFLERLSSPEKAVAAFDKALTLGIPAALREASLVKKIKALFLLDPIKARTFATEYLVDYPDGNYHDQVESWLDEPSQSVR